MPSKITRLRLPAQPPKRDDRLNERPAGDDPDRTKAEQDKDRLLYSSIFRRLTGVGQIMGARESAVFHNRLTHSLKVTQLGRSIARKLIAAGERDGLDLAEQLDVSVVEAACMAHDLGHPPFGHPVERHLNKLVLSWEEKHNPDQPKDGFEANSQTFRLVTSLTFIDATGEFDGLNLTRATLRAILKYPWHREEKGPKSKKWGAYRSESEHFTEALKIGTPEERSLEGDVMDAADELAYAIHDIEDFHRSNLIPWALILGDSREARQYRARLEQRAFHGWTFNRPPQASQHISAALQDMRRTAQSNAALLQERYVARKDQRARLRSLISGLIKDQMATYQLAIDHGVPRLYVPDKTRAELAIWKQITRNYYMEDPTIIAQQLGYARVVTDVWDDLMENLESGKDASIFPGRYHFLFQDARIKEISNARAVADCISGLTEDELVQLHKRLRGLDSPTASRCLPPLMVH